MSRAGRAVRAAHLHCFIRHSGLLVENGAAGRFTTTYSSQSCLQLSRLVPNATSPRESRPEFFSEDGPQRGILSNSKLALKSRSTYSSQLQRNIFTRSFSQVLPEKEVDAGRTEQASSVLQSSEEVTSTDVEVNTDPSKDTNVLVSGLQQETTLVDEDAENDDASEDEAGQESTSDKITALWKKIEKVSKGSKRPIIPLLKEWIGKGDTLDRDTLVSILVKLKRRSRFKQALEISDYMSENKGYKWEQVDQIMRIDLKFKLRQFRSVDAIFEKSPPEFKREGTYNTLIRNYSEHYMVKRAEALFSELKKLEICKSPFAFNQMLLLYKRRRMEEKVPGVLKDMEAAKIALDSYTYNILMDIKSQTGDLKGMEEVFEAMKANEKIQPDAATYGTLATAYLAANQPLKAKEYLEVMESGDFPRSYTAYDILLSQYGVIGDVEGVERIWKQLKSHPYTSNRSYVVAIEAFGNLKQIDKAEEIYMELENKGPVLTSQYNALLKAYSNLGMTDKADALLAKMVTAKRKRNALTYHNVIVGYLKQGELEKALDALKKLKLDTLHGRIKLWLETLLAILEEIAKQGDIVRAEKLFQDIKKEYPKCNTRTYNILLKSYANAKVPAGGFLQRMAADNVQPSHETHSLLQKTGLQV